MLDTNAVPSIDRLPSTPPPSDLDVGLEPSKESIGALATRRLKTAAEALSIETSTWRGLADLMPDLLGGAASARPGAAPFPSAVGDDHSPFELSVAFGSRGTPPELRVLTEPQPSASSGAPTLLSNAAEARRLLARLAANGVVSLERFERVADLFLPAEPTGDFALWLAVSATSAGVEAKLYLCPEARGRHRAAAVVDEALCRLGFTAAWPTIARTLLARGPRLDELSYFALDLSPGPTARVKVYARHHGATADDAERAVSSAREHVPGSAREFVQLMGGRTARFEGRPLTTCLAYVDGDGSVPAAATVYVPVNDYAPSDAVIATRVLDLFDRYDLDATPYQRVVRALAGRPLEGRVGLQSYVALKHRGGEPVVTVYLAAESHRTGAVASSNAPATPRTLPAFAARMRSVDILAHPTFTRLARESVQMERFTVLFENALVAMVENLVPRVAATLARIDDPWIRAMLASLLHDELGRGNGADGHAGLFRQMTAAFARWRPDVTREQLIAPGRGLARALDEVHFARPAFEGLGALMLFERYGAQVSDALARELSRQSAVTGPELRWITIHQELEKDHADDSLALAVRAGIENLPELVAGVDALERAAWAFFDGIYALCFLRPAADSR